MALNDQVVIEELDIFAKVGRGVAQDELVPFQVRNNKLVIKGKTTAFNNEIRVEFLKVSDLLLLECITIKLTLNRIILPLDLGPTR